MTTVDKFYKVNFNQHIGNRIAKLRITKKLSQENLAFKANIDRTYISSIERGKRSISLAVAIKISSALDVNLLKLTEKKDGTYINGHDLS